MPNNETLTLPHDGKPRRLNLTVATWFKRIEEGKIWWTRDGLVHDLMLMSGCVWAGQRRYARPEIMKRLDVLQAQYPQLAFFAGTFPQIKGPDRTQILWYSDTELGSEPDLPEKSPERREAPDGRTVAESTSDSLPLYQIAPSERHSIRGGCSSPTVHQEKFMKSKKPISVLVVRVGQEPVLCYLPPDPSLETLQELVGGGICGPSIGFGLSVYANGDGLRLRLPYNRCGLVGDFFVMKDSSAGNPIAMTDKDIARAKDWLARNYHRPPYCHVCGSPGGATLFCPCRDVLIFCCGCYDKLAEVMNGSDLGEQKRFGLCPRCRERN